MLANGNGASASDRKGRRPPTTARANLEDAVLSSVMQVSYQKKKNKNKNAV